MDLLKSIKNKSEFFSDTEEDQGVSSVVSHIEIAERHYESGKKGDDYYFNDVIYRCNQAFEGALKEAYRIITNNDPDKLTPHKIEKYFEQNNVLRERVLYLFTNYRTAWRNKSTHDYKLYFSEQEAFLAIVNISAFINILFDQMIEKRAYDREAAEIKTGHIEKVPINKKENLLDNSIELLTWFSKVIPEKVTGTAFPQLTEKEVIGSLSAYINVLGGNIDAKPEYAILGKNGSVRYRADFLFEKNNEKLLIEIKNYKGVTKRHLSDGSDQLSTYMAASGINNGILYIPPLKMGTEMSIERIERMIGNKVYNIVQIFPRK